MSKKAVSQKYADLIRQENQLEQELEFTVETSSQQADADLLAVKQQIFGKAKELQQAKSNKTSFSLTKCAELQYEISRLEAIQAVMVAIKAELF